MTESMKCGCRAAPKLVFSCSGAADVGEVSDQAARLLAREGIGKMSCLAGIGGRNPDIMRNTRQASSILAIDGCQSACASKTLKEAGFDDFISLKLASIGLQKGSSPASTNNIDRVTEAARQLLAQNKGE